VTCNHQVAGAGAQQRDRAAKGGAQRAEGEGPSQTRRSPPISNRGRMFHRGELRSQRDWADASSVVSTNGPACSVEARIPGRDSEEGATPFRSTNFKPERC